MMDTTCAACGETVHFYKGLTGGKRFGQCACKMRTWILDGNGPRFVEHTPPAQHAAACSCHYRSQHRRAA